METFVASEQAMLERMLDVQREEVALILSEVDDTAARARLVPSLTTPLGLVKHATFVEKVWFHSRVAGVPRVELGLPNTIDESFVLEPEDTVDSVRGAFLAACEHSREVAAGRNLDEQFPWHQGPVSLRFIYGHMIAELRPSLDPAALFGAPRSRVEGKKKGRPTLLTGPAPSGMTCGDAATGALGVVGEDRSQPDFLRTVCGPEGVTQASRAGG